MKKADENEKNNGNLVKLEGVDGLWYKQPDILSKFKRRPDELEKICYTHFGKMIKRVGKLNTFSSSKEDESNYSESDAEYSTDEQEDPKKNFILSLWNTMNSWKKYQTSLN